MPDSSLLVLPTRKHTLPAPLEGTYPHLAIICLWLRGRCAVVGGPIECGLWVSRLLVVGCMGWGALCWRIAYLTPAR